MADLQVQLYGTLVFGHFYVAYIATVQTCEAEGLEVVTAHNMLFHAIFDGMTRVSHPTGSQANCFFPFGTVSLAHFCWLHSTSRSSFAMPRELYSIWYSLSCGFT